MVKYDPYRNPIMNLTRIIELGNKLMKTVVVVVVVGMIMVVVVVVADYHAISRRH